jgi:hypothetical protein
LFILANLCKVCQYKKIQLTNLFGLCIMYVYKSFPFFDKNYVGVETLNPLHMVLMRT